MHIVRKARRCRPRNAASFSFLIAATLYSFCSFAAVAEIYPVNGVWTAIGPAFPINRHEACLSLKTFGTEAVSGKSIPELIIFTKVSGTLSKAMLKTRPPSNQSTQRTEAFGLPSRQVREAGGCFSKEKQNTS